MKLRLIHSTILHGDIVTKYKQLYGDDRVTYTAFAQESGDVRLHKEVDGKSQRMTRDEISALSQRFVLNSKVAAAFCYSDDHKVAIVSRY